VLRETERASAALESHEGRTRGSFNKARNTVSVTISIGVAFRELRSEKPDEVLKRADKALYKAKDAGRNCVKALKSPEAKQPDNNIEL
jgi:diguanylate cyclase (GGDEF)-like protein